MHRIFSGSFAADAIVNNAPNANWFPAKEEFLGEFYLPDVAQLALILTCAMSRRVDGLVISPLLLPQR